MPRLITLAAAQTGPVNGDDWRPNVAGACAMIEEAGRRKLDILSFWELFLTPFFPNRLTRDYDKREVLFLAGHRARALPRGALLTECEFRRPRGDAD
ncbi:MAG: hypothetical protein FJY40_05435 [Betaproteobacteria bacterium]|nr:hypothetical protein [Betaproteobacteria bacterium]